MTGLDKIINQILDEANNSANEKLEEAKAKAKEIMDKAEAEAKAIEEEISKKIRGRSCQLQGSGRIFRRFEKQDRNPGSKAGSDCRNHGKGIREILLEK